MVLTPPCKVHIVLNNECESRGVGGKWNVSICLSIIINILLLSGVSRVWNCWSWWGQNDKVPAPGKGPVDVGLQECGCHGHKACCITMYIFYLPPLRNVLPVNVNDSMIIWDSKSLGGDGVANVSAKCLRLRNYIFFELMFLEFFSTTLKAILKVPAFTMLLRH